MYETSAQNHVPIFSLFREKLNHLKVMSMLLHYNEISQMNKLQKFVVYTLSNMNEAFNRWGDSIV